MAYLLDCEMSRTDYEKQCKLINIRSRILPPYYLVEAEKQKCRPPGIVGNPHEVFVPLGNLLNHTVSRILEFEDVQDQISRLSEINNNEKLDFYFFYKYGMDGSGGISKIKQVFCIVYLTLIRFKMIMQPSFCGLMLLLTPHIWRMSADFLY